HPQPYYDLNNVQRRLITPAFLALAHHALVSDGQFFLQTDNPGYWRYMREVVPVFFEFEERQGTWLDAPKGRTRREIIALRRGLPVFRGSGRARRGPSEAAAIRLAEARPAPTLHRDPPLQGLGGM